jgi:hypothetical protein
MKILDVPQSGSVGGRTSSRNSSGQYVRARAMPTQPRTAAQINARSRLGTLAAGWRGLTAAQRASWIAFGQSFTGMNSLGTAIHYTGTQCYVKVNSINMLLGRAIVLVPPALPAFVACTATGLTVNGTAPAMTVTGVTCTAGTTHMAFMSAQVSAGVTFMGNYRFIAGFSTYTTGSYNILAAYTGKFGTLVTGKQVFIKIVQEQLGMQDNGTVFSAIAS